MENRRLKTLLVQFSILLQHGARSLGDMCLMLQDKTTTMSQKNGQHLPRDTMSLTGRISNSTALL